MGTTKKIILTLLLTLSLPSNAGSISFGGLSHHFFSKIINNFHRAVIYERSNYVVGYIKNSHDKDSYILSYKVWDYYLEGVTLEGYFGVIRGYYRCYRGRHSYDTNSKKVFACPLGVLSATIETETAVKPQISLWGDAIVLTGKITF